MSRRCAVRRGLGRGLGRRTCRRTRCGAVTGVALRLRPRFGGQWPAPRFRGVRLSLHT
ncbi:hypothetical protein OIE66_37845 [Nonomuraea sp. NBC_01738]|uniref:hypothetical protein n=1 Tax=Nonomuraea sp. NBC_01738 TaxID=2976003 RepID=UPI002E161C6C|nr:hypothetical protein OIE66_37845 [Nonomuraea sp. NBC_01738]